jgi:HEAT repeat protein
LGELEQATGLLLGLATDGSVAASVRRTAASALGQLGQASEGVLQGLLGLATDGSVDAYVRLKAASALSQLGQANEPVLNGLLGLLNFESIPASRMVQVGGISWNDYVKNAVYQSLQRLISPDDETTRE